MMTNTEHPSVMLQRLLVEKHNFILEIEHLRSLLERCRTVLGNMALENEGAIFNRWPISHEPLRHDAKNLVPLIDAALDV